MNKQQLEKIIDKLTSLLKSEFDIDCDHGLICFCKSENDDICIDKLRIQLQDYYKNKIRRIIASLQRRKEYPCPWEHTDEMFMFIDKGLYNILNSFEKEIEDKYLSLSKSDGK